LAAPDAEVVLRQPEGVETQAITQLRQLAQFLQQVAPVTLPGHVVRVMEIAEAHRRLLPISRIWYTISLPRRSWQAVTRSAHASPYRPTCVPDDPDRADRLSAAVLLRHGPARQPC